MRLFNSCQLPTTKDMSLSREWETHGLIGDFENMKGKKKLDQRDTCMGTTQVFGNCGPLREGVLKPLKREKILGVQDLKTFSGNSYVSMQRDAAWTGTERFYLSFLQIYFQSLPPLKGCGTLEVNR